MKMAVSCQNEGKCDVTLVFHSSVNGRRVLVVGTGNTLGLLLGNTGQGTGAENLLLF